MTKHPHVLTTVCLLISAAILSLAHGQGWTRFRGPNGTGTSEANTIPVKWTTEDYKWRVKLPGSGHSSPVISGDRIFVTSKRGCALLRTTEDGLTEIWQNRSMKSYFQSSVLHEGNLYGFDGELTEKCRLTCLDLATGEKQWDREIDFASLILADDKLLV